MGTFTIFLLNIHELFQSARITPANRLTQCSLHSRQYSTTKNSAFCPRPGRWGLQFGTGCTELNETKVIYTHQIIVNWMTPYQVLKQVPSASDHSFKNDKNDPGVVANHQVRCHSPATAVGLAWSSDISELVGGIVVARNLSQPEGPDEEKHPGLLGWGYRH